ncbi:zinc dependent phospholipase C family protein [Cohnella yongneupensis]|uniref:Zinc dependent phospholipase C family protein n=1 Tax=Cohnella yongneupensis TaxID=425006 RepID=A0ABW0QVG9_9BACL
MPNLWAHIQFGRELLTELRQDEALRKPEWKVAFQLGCQGPDFLFYHHYLPWQSSTALNQLGTLQHNVRCGLFLLSLFEESRDREFTDPAVAYTLGFLLHHVLDRHLHPFVFSLSGFRKWHHQRFETTMDSAIMHLRAGIHTGRVPVAPEIDTGDGLPGGLSGAFARISAAHYPALADRVTPALLDEAVRSMVSAQRLFFDPTGIKGRLTFGQIAPFSPPKRQPDWDVLNVARAPWIDPCDRTIVHRESALELWDRALADGREVMAAAIAWLAEPDASKASSLRATFAGLLGDVSYETGRTCGTAWITFAESIVP